MKKTLEDVIKEAHPPAEAGNERQKRKRSWAGLEDLKQELEETEKNRESFVNRPGNMGGAFRRRKICAIWS